MGARKQKRPAYRIPPSVAHAGTPSHPHPFKTTATRKRSRNVAFGVAGAIALACTGFGVHTLREPRQCVDPATQVVVDDDDCRSGGTGRWYYGGRSSGIGSKATDGSYERGGFGRFFSGGG